ncbi:conserved hypothetical protein [Hyella patelloides LEGE 07179]|uniref:Uncharacterized protein n=1 Tax=Hyella patelloides LEGE 07179 TaxID=945734 RepID=A0A563VRG1_9CYAN|nr:hypothetical protein [Hyella patelloides]VEP13989.1 conserved hypothetical protein [Hyella patelloides LEGE 07179]
MIVTYSQENKKRIFTTPPSTLSLSTNTINIPSTVISVEVAEDESVEWIWTIYPDGQKVVTGYNIIKNS